MITLNDNLDSNFGMATCVGMQQLMDPKDRNHLNSQNFTNIYMLEKCHSSNDISYRTFLLSPWIFG